MYETLERPSLHLLLHGPGHRRHILRRARTRLWPTESSEADTVRTGPTHVNERHGPAAPPTRRRHAAARAAADPQCNGLRPSPAPARRARVGSAPARSPPWSIPGQTRRSRARSRRSMAAAWRAAKGTEKNWNPPAVRCVEPTRRRGRRTDPHCWLVNGDVVGGARRAAGEMRVRARHGVRGAHERRLS